MKRRASKGSSKAAGGSKRRSKRRSEAASGSVGPWVVGGLAVAGIAYMLLTKNDGPAAVTPEFDRMLSDPTSSDDVLLAWMSLYQLGFTREFPKANDDAFNANLFAQAKQAAGFSPTNALRQACVLWVQKMREAKLKPLPTGSAAANARLRRVTGQLVTTCATETATR